MTGSTERLATAGQRQLVEVLARARPADAAALRAQLADQDLELIARLVGEFIGHDDDATPATGALTPPDAIAAAPDARARTHASARPRHAGAAALRAGRVGLVLLAGGQGTRLGSTGRRAVPRSVRSPARPCSPICRQGRRVAGAVRRPPAAGVLTSPANDAATRAAFSRAGWFGLDPDTVRFVVQGTLPAVDAATGRSSWRPPDGLALSPDGHGGRVAGPAPLRVARLVRRPGHPDAVYLPGRQPADEHRRCACSSGTTSPRGRRCPISRSASSEPDERVGV